MPRFDVYQYDGDVPLLLDVQADILGDLKTRVVVPLLLQSKGGQESMPKLKPVVKIKGKNYILMTTDIGSELTRDLGPVLVNIEDQRQIVVDALDFLMQGF